MAIGVMEGTGTRSRSRSTGGIGVFFEFVALLQEELKVSSGHGLNVTLGFRGLCAKS